MIKNLIFDFGKVLVDYNFDTFFKKHIPNEKRRQEVIPIIYNTTLQQLLDREEQPYETIIEKLISQNKEYEPELRTFSKHYTELVTGEIEGMSELLSQLKKEGYKLYGLSNWCSKVHQTMAQFKIFSLLDGYIISSEEKVIKPEAEIYHRLFKKFGIKPEESVFTDDRPENIQAGKNLNMHGIVFTTAQQYEKDLRKIIGK